MRFPDYSPMLLVATLVAATVVGAVTPASAQGHVSDVDYLNMSRCAGLAEGMGRDSSALKQRVAIEGRGRDTVIYDRGVDVRSEAARQARLAGEDVKRHLIAESDGVCAAFTSPAQVAGR